MLLDQVRQTISRHCLLHAGETVVVGVSGGPDSLCLLHVLCRLAGDYDLRLHVAHLDHGLRGVDAASDAEFVRAVSREWDLPCTAEHADVPALARGSRLAVEEAARRARYAFLARVARDAGAQTVAVGHNADDQAETVLMHWMRGSGLAGLRGMSPRIPLSGYRLFDPIESELSTVRGLFLIRPLLEVTRSDVEAYCRSCGLEPRFDRSNLDTTYFRNWLRHTVLPLLAQHNPNVREAIRRSARVIADDHALLHSLLDEAWPRVTCEVADGRIVFDREAWQALPPSLQRSSLREAIHRLRRSLRNINFVHVEDALTVAREGATGDRATLPQGLMLTVGYGRFSVADAAAAEPQPGWPLLPAGIAALPVALPGTTGLPGSDWVLVAEGTGRTGLPSDWEENREPWLAFVDAQAVGERLWLRTRQPGDRFDPLGLAGHTVRLGDFLTNRKVPRAARDRLPLLVDDRGIVWVCGQRLAARVSIRDATARVLVLSFVRCSVLPEPALR